jgi:hypothetical protein
MRIGEKPMGDKSPKSKQRGQQQKDATKKQDASNAAAKQQRQAVSPSGAPGKKK